MFYLRTQYQDPYGNVSTMEIPVEKGYIIAFLAVTLAVTLAFYALRSVGIYKLAKNQGVKAAWLAFVPLAWMWTACKLIGKTPLFGKTFASFAILFTVVFAVAGIVPAVINGFEYLPHALRYLGGEDITLAVTSEGYYFEPLVVFSTEVITILRILQYLNYFLNLASIIITVFVYINLFKKFWPEHYIIAAVFSFFGLFPPFVFAIRNNKAVNYADYLRSRFYGYGMRGSGASGVDPDGYARKEEERQRREEPFAEFSDKPEDPFSEFSGKGADDDEKNVKDRADDDPFVGF